ncbi:hypothetical protein HAZT_HAZT008969 [Hyalella azteca]|uniref:Topoisomerase 6 subunit A/Spo11 TOPRIM domain-containing protein n=1 Tax=Hyalella azteca TaxID=294128 RepID=A0A6A0GVI5_HYAAZ|nr:hypothetical protein HAZT_HAZT008969 [Hyalella azteca]
MAGSLRYVTQEGVAVDVASASNGKSPAHFNYCTCGRLLVPDCVSGLRELQSDARYVLVVEKDCTFQKIIDAHFLRAYGPCILLTGKGYPDLCTRELCARLWRELQLPVLALTDADPHGLHIAAVYKFGSNSHSEPEYCTAGLVWLGVLPSDLAGLQLPERHRLPLLPSDYGKLATLQAHPSIMDNPAWFHQTSVMQRLGYKAEIQNLVHIAPDFLTSVYLPAKLRHAGWVP